MQSFRYFLRAKFLVFFACKVLDISNMQSFAHFSSLEPFNTSLSLQRSDLHKDVIKGSEILEVLHQTPEVNVQLLLFLPMV